MSLRVLRAFRSKESSGKSELVLGAQPFWVYLHNDNEQFLQYRLNCKEEKSLVTVIFLWETRWLKPLTLASHHSNHLFMSYFRTGGHGKEHRTNMSPPFRKGQKETLHVLPRPRIILTGWVLHPFSLSNACASRKFPESEWLAKDNLEINPISINPRPQGRAFLLGSLILMFSAQAPLPNKVSCCVSTCVSSDNSFLSIRQEPLFRTWNRFPLPAIVSSCDKMRDKKESLPQIHQDGLLLSLGLMWLPDRLWGRILRSVFLRRNNLVNLSYNALLGKISMSGSFNLKLLQYCACGHLFSCILKPTTIHRIKSRLWLFQRNYKHES